MTKERDREELNTLVSETYRKLPALRAPEHLNRAILRMAEEKDRGKADFLFAKWVKPVTLAATIALSLAIVLELSEVPVASVPMEVAPAAREENVPPETDRPDKGLIEELVLEDTDLAKSEANGKIGSFAASPPAAALPVARKKAADIRVSNQPAASSTIGLSMEIGESVLAAACDERVRQSANSWLECIDQLREAGATQDADREYEAFMLEYPTGSADPESNK